MKSATKLRNYVALALLAIATTSCGTTTLTQENFTTSINNIFRNDLLPNQELGKLDSNALTLGNIVGKKEGYTNEKEVVSDIVSKLKKIDYVVFQGNDNLFYVYEINFLNGKDLSIYPELRSIKVRNDFSTAKLVCISSKRKHFRFYNGENSPVYKPVSTPEEAISRLQNMEIILSKNLDHRGLFATMYRVITQRAYKELQIYKQQGNLKAAKFEEDLMINFANKYFQAYDNYASNNISGVKEVWRMAFDSGRKSQDLGLNKSGNIAEILGLSMNAHIIHDLPFTLKEIGYDVKDPVLKSTFDRFNTVLFEEKDNILSALKQRYGKNIVNDANDFFGPVGNWTMQKVFSVMRTIASSQAAYSDKNKIERTAISFGDGIMDIVPGGNSIRTANN